MNITLRDLQVVKTIDEHGNLSRAAEILCVSQSALSHQIKKIETSIQIEVFIRDHKRMTLTQAGQKMLDSSTPIFKEMDLLKNNLNTLRDGTSGTIKISTECYTCYHWLPPILIAFKEKYPLAQIEIVSEATRKPLEYLDQSKIDLAIVSEVPENKHYAAHPLFKNEMVVVLSKNHPLAKKKKLDPSDFENQTLVLYDVPDENLFFLREIIKPNQVNLKQVMKLQLTEAIIEMAAAGIGIAVMAQWAISSYLDTKQLVTFPVPKKRVFNKWHALVSNHRNQPLLNHFVSFINQWKFEW